VASVGFVGWAAVTGASWPARFLPLQAASLPFSLGALLYHYQDRLPRMGFGHVALAAALFVGNLVFAVHIAVSMQARYLPVATSVYLIAALRQVDPGRLPVALRRADRGLGACRIRSSLPTGLRRRSCRWQDCPGAAHWGQRSSSTRPW